MSTADFKGYSPGKSDLGMVVLAIAKHVVVTLGLMQSKVNQVAHDNLEYGMDIYNLDLRNVVLLSYQYHPVISPFHACSFLILYPPRSWYSLVRDLTREYEIWNALNECSNTAPYEITRAGMAGGAYELDCVRVLFEQYPAVEMSTHDRTMFAK
jgi:hypothetical protein